MSQPLVCHHPPLPHHLFPPLTSAVMHTAPQVQLIHQLCIGKHHLAVMIDPHQQKSRLPLSHCRDIRCSSVHRHPYLLTDGSHDKRFDIFEHSNSLSPASIKLSPCDQMSASPADTDFASPFPASNAHEPLPNTSNHSMTLSNTEISSAMHGTTDDRPSRSSRENHEASGHSPDQLLGHKVTMPSSYGASSSSDVKEAATRAKSPAVEVAGLQPMKKAPRSNSVKQYHRSDSVLT